MGLTNTCFEIVHFAFQTGVPLDRQTALMKRLGNWAATQPGFIERRGYHDRQHNRWTDVVEWRSLEEAQAAMALSQNAPELAEAMAAIAENSLWVGHCERLV